MQAQAQVEFTRPSNTTAYAAGDVVTATVAAILEFAGLAWQPGGRGYVKGSVLQKNTANITNSKFRLHLYSQSIATVGNDNAQAVLRYTDRDSYLGTIEYPLMINEPGSVYASISIDNELSVPFKCGGATKNLFGVLVAEAAYVPASGEQFCVRLSVERE